jgi:hypothetical protein
MRLQTTFSTSIACCAAWLLFPTVAGAQLVIGGWDSARGGNNNIVDGSATGGFRSAVAQSFPGATIAGTDTLTAEYLTSVNVLVLSSVMDGADAATPLTTSEQSALRSFVLDGGRLIVLTGNNTFAGPSTNQSNDSFLYPFGFDVTNTINGDQNSTVPNPDGSPVTRGPYGYVSSWTSYYPGYFDQIGIGGTTLSTLDSDAEPSLEAVAPGALAPGSGGIALFSDWLPLTSAAGTPDMNLIMNAISWDPAPAPPGALVALIGACSALPLLRRRR